jgi:AcrR family transcriptional regulator
MSVSSVAGGHNLWEESIDGHRRAVREAITAAAWHFAEQHGPLALTMSQVAKAAGIGRATLYKYFTDVESILIAHHAQHVEGHLQALDELRRGPGPVGSRLVAVVRAYAAICFHRARHSSIDVSALVHRGPVVADAEDRLRGVFAQLIEEAVAEGLVREDVSSVELAEYCLHALAAAGEAADPDRVERLIRVVLDGLGSSPDVSEGVEFAATLTHDGRELLRSRTRTTAPQTASPRAASR